MTSYSETDCLEDTYFFETSKLLDDLEQIILECERIGNITSHYDQIKRILHTIKGNSMTLEFEKIAELSHANEDLIIFTVNSKDSTNLVEIVDILLDSIDFIRDELLNIKENNPLSCDISDILEKIHKYLR